MNANAAIALLKKVGVFDLAGTDGCLCMSCEVQGISIDVSCRKSSGAHLSFNPEFRGVVVRVHSRHLDQTHADLQRVADEVVAQLKDDADDIVTRLCDYSSDRELLCAYCGKPRTNKAGYFCSEHEARESDAS